MGASYLFYSVSCCVIDIDKLNRTLMKKESDGCESIFNHVKIKKNIYFFNNII